MSVLVYVVTDLYPDQFIMVDSKAPTELPNKFFVDYCSRLQEHGQTVPADRQPVMAQRYKTQQHYQDRLEPANVNMVDSMTANGFAAGADGQVLFLAFDTASG
jgi:hypothetical protein